MMIEEHYLNQLKRRYKGYLSALVAGAPFEPIRLIGGKAKPSTTKELEESVRSFLRFQKTPDNPGWEINWENWTSKKLGVQQWPSEVVVTTETDMLYLLKKEKEVANFRNILQQLTSWNPKTLSWLSDHPERVLELKDKWKGICAVLDYLLQHDVSGRFIRSLPVPVHTKFIQQNSTLILALLKHLAPDRFTEEGKDLEDLLGLLRKPLLFPMRWLDISLARPHTAGMELIGVSSSILQSVSWPVKEIWLVENETNLYLLPYRPDAMALFARGNALPLLRNIPLFQQCRLLYWGDLDEDGFLMLHRFRQMYPHAESLLMNEATVKEHLNEIHTIQYRNLQIDLNLTPTERNACNILKERQGRIEQEQIRQDWMLAQIEMT